MPDQPANEAPAPSWAARAVQLAYSSPISVGFLIATNMVPLVGVLFLGWSISTVLVAYWLESGVVGLLNVPKIVLAGRGDEHTTSYAALGVLALFFVFHYGLFWLVHGAFVFALTSGFAAGPDPSPIDRETVNFMALLLVISHGASFVVNYIGRGEYRRTTPAAQMAQPYARVFILHITIVLGAFFVIFLGQPIALVALLVVLKTIADLALHLRERRTVTATALIT